jgi:hypothetical protein
MPSTPTDSRRRPSQCNASRPVSRHFRADVHGTTPKSLQVRIVRIVRMVRHENAELKTGKETPAAQKPRALKPTDWTPTPKTMLE